MSLSVRTPRAAGTVCAAAAVLGLAAAFGRARGFAALAAVLLVLALLRVRRLTRELDALADRQDRDAERARRLVHAETALSLARGPAGVRDAVLHAVLSVLGAGQGEPASVVLALGPPELADPVAVRHEGPGTAPCWPRLPAADGAEHWLDPADGTPRSDQAVQAPRGATETADAAEPPPSAVALLLPLSVAGGPVGGLLVQATAARLVKARPALRTLAPAVAAALAAAVLREEPGELPPLAADLARGLREREVLPYFQPVVDLSDGSVVGVEALARWEHPERGLLYPEAFLPAAEQAGLLPQLDLQLLGVACGALSAWAPGYTGPHVCVNLGAPLLRDPRLVGSVRAVLAASCLPPWRLVVEVTEDDVLTEPDLVTGVLADLRALKVRVALDDFGAGSLGLLQRLPVDVVKVDRTLVAALPYDEDARQLVPALVHLAQTLGLEVVAEGVEREEQRRALQESGVGLGQGWLFAPALPAAGARALLGTGHDIGAPPGGTGDDAGLVPPRAELPAEPGGRPHVPAPRPSAPRPGAATPDPTTPDPTTPDSTTPGPTTPGPTTPDPPAHDGGRDLPARSYRGAPASRRLNH